MDGPPQHGGSDQNNVLQGRPKNVHQGLYRQSSSRSRTIDGTIQNTLRTITPEMADQKLSIQRSRTPTRAITPFDIPASPRSIPGGEKSRDRRAGLVFDDGFNASPSSTIPQPIESPLLRSESPSPAPNPRPRTRTLDDPRRPQQPSVSRSRHRVGSVHIASSPPLRDAGGDGISSAIDHLQSQPIATQAKPSYYKTASKDKTIRKLQKRTSERPISPLSSPSPSVDSLTVPLVTSDANKILKIMKTLNGRMRGALEYQAISDGKWSSGLCYIDENKGTLMCEGDDRGPFHSVIVQDLRGCRVKPSKSMDRQMKCLEVTSTDNILRIIPLLTTEFDHWLAAMLFWQQIRAVDGQISLSTEMQDPPIEKMSRSTSSKSIKEATIIKVGKVSLWEKDSPYSSSSWANSSSIRDVPVTSSQGSWQKVSCILQDNGVFKLLREDDIVLLLVIQLNQLSRCAVQRLDRSVLGKEYCIGIFPQYTSTSTSISIIRPVYIALDQRVLFEVWFVLLRAFAIPEIYGNPTLGSEEQSYDNGDEDEVESAKELFRIDKSLTVRVIEAKVRKAPKIALRQEIRASDKTEQDYTIGNYYTEVVLDGEVRARTACKEDTRNPFWREDCEFQDVPSTTPDLTFVLKRRFDVKLDHRPSSDSGYSAAPEAEIVCGNVAIRLDQLEKDREEERWWPILDERQEQVGEMFVKIQYQETVVLPARDYQQISELLHKFTNGLTLQLAQHIPSNLKQLSELLMNIFQVSGQSHNWLTTLVEDEIDGIGKESPPSVRYRFSKRLNSSIEEPTSAAVVDRELSVRDMSKTLAGEANLLFRGNSLLTQALDFHMRRLGKDYLEEVLAEKIAEIDALNPDCEVDPSRITAGEDLTKNWMQLIQLTTGVWEAISISAQRCPPALRHILKCVRAVADDRYGDFLRTVPYTSVSGFLFLRFFCPAILNPKLFDLLRDHPRPKSQRTLTLIAKSLQALANLSTFGQKEAWMEPMNRFLSSHRQEVKTYIDTVTSIPGQSATLALPASYSTPITILGRLPPTSREGFPSLPYLIDHARNFAALVKLWLASTSSQTAVSPFEKDGDLLDFHYLCLDLQRKSDDCLHQAEANANVEEGAMSSNLQWDDLVTSLDNFDMKPLDIANALQPAYAPTNAPSTTGFSAISSTPFLPMVNFDLNIATRRPPASSSSAENVNMAPRNKPTRAGSESERFNGDSKDKKDKRERANFWESAFGKDRDISKRQAFGGSLDHGDAVLKNPPGRNTVRSVSPPLNRGHSRGKKEKEEKKDKERGRRSEDTKREKSTNKETDKDKDKDRHGFLGLAGLRKKIEGEIEKGADREKHKEKEKAREKEERQAEKAREREARSSHDTRERKGSVASPPGNNWNHGGMI